MKLFEEKDNKVIVSPELKLIPEFRAIILRDKDRNKRGSLQEFAYIYFMYDYRSPYSKYSEKERNDRLKKELGFDSFWKPDQLIKAASEKYCELIETPTISLLKSIRDGLIASKQTIDMISRNIQSSVQEGEDADVEEIVKLLTSLFGISDKLPKVIESMTVLEQKIKSEQASDTKLRGGGERGLFED